MNKVKVFKLNQDAKIPTRNKATDAGLDIYALTDCFIPMGETKVVKTGIAIEIPEGYVGKIEDRSSMGAKGLRTGAGVIDTGYAGEVGVVLHNFSANAERDTVLFTEGYKIRKGDKIAQLVIIKVETPEVEETKELWNSARGNNGFGSSGR